jgi:septum formation protein
LRRARHSSYVAAVISAALPLVLGSASPRRREILASLGIAAVALPCSIDEDPLARELPRDYLERIASAKLQAVWGRLLEAESAPSQRYAGVLVADTIVVIGDAILGKPANQDDARAILSRLVGRTHTVMTRYLIASAQGSEEPPGVVAARTIETGVTLRAASEREIAAYAATGEGLDKAGAYAAQGIGAFLVERIEGSYSNVVGLPACEVVADLCRTGLLSAFPEAVPEH